MSSPVSKLRIRTDVDLVTVVPYLLGFRPDDGSIVVLAFADNRVVFAARTDLPGPDTSGDALLDLGHHLTDVTRRAHPNATVLLVGYGTAGHVDPALRTVAVLLTTGGLSVRQRLRVTDSRVVHLDCDHAGCSPDGTPFDPMSSPVAAEATYAGMVALPNRAAKAALLGPADTASGEAMRQAVTRATARMQPLIHDEAAVDEAAAAAIAQALSRHAIGTALGDDEVAWLLVLLARPSVWNLAAGHAEPDEQHLAFWNEVTRRAPDPLIPAPATLLALTAWQLGDGMIATLATQRALHIDPSHELARLILHGAQAGISPADVERALADIGHGSLSDIEPRA
ncbi:DUF4192 domain-containing protein [Solwaraspora sp. WMMD1047]|uniref:DUF4192 domain-containing protein n=1 Tax=Solwaraspora sp. WMMD1047 TaxID=3016102 RepID=UPI002415F498|nr:DUF4192 domain-containing protein [Solwaraspora sp. WMMD1047]MDG4834829.1 DUF4192 domain-containing protein [Solwaraspora sp. WMMD1047]